MYDVFMYIDKVPNRKSPPCILLRESYREDGKVKKRTIANITSWPKEKIASMEKILKGNGRVVENIEKEMTIKRSLPHGHISVILKTIKKLKLDKIISRITNEKLLIVLAMIIMRIISPSSKLSTSRNLMEETSISTLGSELGLENINEDKLYASMDWLLDKQSDIEKKLSEKHLANNTLIMYDLSSSYFEGNGCPIAKYGYSRDHRKDKLQIEYGLMCNKEGCPISIEVFEGNISDSKTLSSQVEKIQKKFKLKNIVLVGDRGMITTKKIEEELADIEDLEWISALKTSEIRKVLSNFPIQLTFLDKKIAEVSHKDFPGERLLFCKNPLVEEKRKKARAALIEATEKELEKIVVATKREKRTLKGKEKIAFRVGKNINKKKVSKYFKTEITDSSFHYERDNERIEKDERLDGIYIIRTSVNKKSMNDNEVVSSYKNLSLVENAFRSLKTVDLKIRPIYHYNEKRAKSHVLICMLAYYVEWHLRQSLKPILFDDHEKIKKQSPVDPYEPSESAKRKAKTKRSDDNLPIHSFQTLMKDLSTIVKSEINFDNNTFFKTTIPTKLQQKALDLLNIKAL